jgi:NAD(P)-dependent dehydrogenase (short-subunit alcohol dehydrogenase family)
VSVIAILGAGQGLGQAIGKLFGKHGHKVALLSRDPAKLEPIVAELAAAGIEAAAFRADVTDAASIKSGLAAVKQSFGAIDVLEYSPSNATLPHAPASQITRDTLQPWFDFQLYGAIAAVAEVLPGMLERKSGTILVTTGASSVRPEAGYPAFAAAGVAMGALRNWALALHAEVAPSGVQVGHVAIGAFIGQDAESSADAIAPLYWQLHTERDALERVFR